MIFAVDGAGGGGVAIEAPRPYEGMLKTPSQILYQRYEDWRRDHEDGVPDRRGRRVRRSKRLIASLYGVEPSTVGRGIEMARRIRDVTARVAACQA